MKTYTNRGSKWELMHSAWILLSYVWLGFVSFFHIGHKVRYRKWTLFGLLYAVLFTVSFFVITEREYFPNHEEQAGNVGVLILFVYWIVTIVHCHKSRKEYLIRLDEMKDTPDLEAERIRQQVRDKYKQNTSSNDFKEQLKEHVGAPVPPVEHQETEVPVEKIDVNNCTVEQYTSLPGISIVMAKTAEQYRKEQGEFKTVDEFFEVIKLKPHFIVQIQDRVVCNHVEKQEPMPSKGRKLDL